MNNTSAFSVSDRTNINKILIDLGITALIAAGIIFPLITWRLIDNPSGLVVGPRYFESFLGILLVVCGRASMIMLERHILSVPLVVGAGLLVLAFAVPWPATVLQVLAAIIGLVSLIATVRLVYANSRSRVTVNAVEAENKKILLFRKILNYVAVFAVLFAVVLPTLPYVQRYHVDIATLIVTYVLLGWGINIIVGYAGLLDLGYVAFYGTGAYLYAITATSFDLTFWQTLPLAGVLAASFGLLLGFPILRLRGDYFAIVTLGFGEIVRLILINWVELTNGSEGISRIPRPSFFGLPFVRRPDEGVTAFHQFFNIEFSTYHRIVFLYYVVLLLALILGAFTVRIRNLPIGRAWEAMREDEIACFSLGINRTRIKLTAFGISAMWGGIAGAFFATKQGFINPESFTFIESAIILAVAVLGGLGNLFGIALAAILLVGLPEVFRDLANYRMIAFGAGLVIIMVWRPRGLISFRDPSILFFKKGDKNKGKKVSSSNKRGKSAKTSK